jgi:hypothetical protein
MAVDYGIGECTESAADSSCQCNPNVKERGTTNCTNHSSSNQANQWAAASPIFSEEFISCRQTTDSASEPTGKGTNAEPYKKNYVPGEISYQPKTNHSRDGGNETDIGAQKPGSEKPSKELNAAPLSKLGCNILAYVFVEF